MVFILDIVFTFRSGFVENGIYCMDKTRIMWNYIRGWLVVDLLASIPLSFIELALPKNQELDSTLQFFKLLRMLRLARLTRILGRMELRSFAGAVANTALRGVDSRLPPGWVAIFPERSENLCGISRKVPLVSPGRR